MPPGKKPTKKPANTNKPAGQTSQRQAGTPKQGPKAIQASQQGTKTKPMQKTGFIKRLQNLFLERKKAKGEKETQKSPADQAILKQRQIEAKKLDSRARKAARWTPFAEACKKMRLDPVNAFKYYHEKLETNPKFQVKMLDARLDANKAKKQFSTTEFYAKWIIQKSLPELTRQRRRQQTSP